MAPTLQRFPFFQLDGAGAAHAVSKAPAGELAPLTILPTAKYFREAA